ncbi:MAG: hypothetical protein HN348_09155, partial [Proteobacteria bacterium]|nr:hypothetical protein [Pseudomonadota bacterium]
MRLATIATMLGFAVACGPGSSLVGADEANFDDTDGLDVVEDTEEPVDTDQLVDTALPGETDEPLNTDEPVDTDDTDGNPVVGYPDLVVDLVISDVLTVEPGGDVEIEYWVSNPGTFESGDFELAFFLS